MKKRIDTILPIALALVLPGLSFYTAEPQSIPDNANVFPIWAISSLVLYNIWYLFWNLWDIRRKFSNRKYLLKLLVFSAGSIGLFIFSKSTNFQDINAYSFGRSLFGVFLFIVIQYALRSQQNIARLQVEKEQIQTESYKAKLTSLQAKIDPHFLFNSLNTLRSMVRQSHANSEKFILSLSDFYRQTLKYNEEIRLPLSEELTVLESYLFLMKNRNEAAVRTDISVDKKLHSFFLPTLALQVVVENCFKHNSMTSSKPLHIAINDTDDGYIEVTNNIQPKIGAIESSGTGLDSLTKRYELMGVAQGVLVEQNTDRFSVKLKLIEK